jgi:hypothetical protein
MHLPTGGAIRGSGSLERAAKVARDVVRVCSDMECLTLMSMFLNRDEALLIRLALQEVPDDQRLYRFGQFRQDEPIMVSLAVNSRESVTREALADGLYGKTVVMLVRKYGYLNLADDLARMRSGRTWDLSTVRKEERHFGIPLTDEVCPTSNIGRPRVKASPSGVTGNRRYWRGMGNPRIPREPWRRTAVSLPE